MPVRVGILASFLCLAVIYGAFAVSDAAAAPRHALTAALKPGAAPLPEEPLPSRGAVAVVNDSIVSDYDLNQRMSLFLATSGMHPSDDQKKKIREQLLRSLVDEILELQAAAKAKVTVSKEEVDKAMESISKQNNATPQQIEQMLGGIGVNVATLRQQVTAEIAWQKYLQGEAGRIQVSDEEVDAELKRIEEGAHKPQFQVSELFVAVDAPNDDEKIRSGINQIVQQLSAGASFPAAARQFSQSPSAAAGGDIGWVQQGQLAPELDMALSTMKRGEIVGPIRVGAGYYVLQLRDRREPAGTATPKQQDPQKGVFGPVPLARLLLVLPPKPSNEIKEKAMGFAQELRARVDSCPRLQQFSKQIQGTNYMNLGTMRPNQMSPELRKALENTAPGEVAEPFLSSAGIEIIARCEPRAEKVVAFEMPTRQQIENRLFQERMSLLSRRYLRDLRRDAVVEYK